MWPRKVVGPSPHRRRSTSGSWKETSAARGRRIVFEPLEDRRLLSVGMLHPEIAGQAAFLANSLSAPSTQSAASPNAAVNAAATGPTIGQVVVSQTKGKISWSVSDTLRVTSSTLQVDGLAPTVSGPFAGTSGAVNFSGSLPLLALGSHSFRITATDSAGNSTSFSGTFTVAPPTISGVVISLAKGRISWNVASPNGVASSALQIDGLSVSNVAGPFTTANGSVNFFGPLGALGGGLHSYTITATDKAGNVSTISNTFNVNATGPVISQVAISQPTNKITWNVSDLTPIANSTLQIDGTTVLNVSGPFPAATGGENFSAPLGSLSIGTHTYFITATDMANNTSSSTASFSITATPGSGPTISQVVVSEATGRVSWNAVDPSGVVSSTLAIDGIAVAGVAGPFTASTGGVNFSGPLGNLADGTHTITITATDGAHVTSTFSEDFSVGSTADSPPVISAISVSGPLGTITWNVADSAGVAGSTLTIDNHAVTVNGPAGTPTSANFSASLGLLSAGPHTFTITATDTLAEVATLTSTFTLATQTSVGPTLSNVVVSESKARISWNAVDPTGVTASTISIDGFPVANVSGPFTAGSGVNFSAPLDSLLAGTHSYTITGFDGLGSQATVSGTFTLAATTTYDPMLSQVVISQVRSRISWNVLSPNTIVSSAIQIDGVTVASVSGPFAASSGVNFSVALGSLVAGSHSYRITATDNLGRQSALLANFNLTAATSAAVAAAQNAVFSSLADSTLANSAKVDGLFAAVPTDSLTSASGTNVA
ncbi:MAG: hypothetical protein WCB27_02620 [Thermoguttaceae bacterium]